VVRESVAPAADRHPKHVRQATGILLDLDRARLAAPDDPTEQRERNPLHLAGMMIGPVHHSLGVFVQHLYVIRGDRHDSSSLSRGYLSCISDKGHYHIYLADQSGLPIVHF